jgi:DNA-binding response OmpR family regulator
MKIGPILLLEDDPILSTEISTLLRNKDIEVSIALDGEQFWAVFHSKDFQLLILDVNVPIANGLEICAKVRDLNTQIPILMLTALSEISDKIQAFEMGADDYLTKPFHFEELYIRIQALVRRGKIQRQEENIIHFSEIKIDDTKKEVYRNTLKIDLTPKEYKLLLMLIRARGHILSKQDIADQLWDYHIETNINTIEVYINFLRKKIDSPFEQKMIQTKVGFGYYIKSTDEF